MGILGSLAVFNWWNNENGGITLISGLNCNGTEENIFDCLTDDNAPVCPPNGADANVVCPGMFTITMYLLKYL